MAREQLGVCAEDNLHSLFLMFNCFDGCESAIRKVLAELPQYFQETSDEHFESMLTGVVAVGALYWDVLYPNQRPKQLSTFPQFSESEYAIPDTPFDLFVMIRSDRLDINHLVGREVFCRLSEFVEIAEEVNGFRYSDGRDLTGFKQGISHPKGSLRRDIALVQDDATFKMGSYIHVQRFVHNLSAWQLLSLEEQEDIMGCSKQRNEPKGFAQQQPYSHFSRTMLIAEDGSAMEVLSHSMPYGDMKKQGSYQVSCCFTPSFFERLLESQYIGSGQGNCSRFLDYMQAETGALFFAPSVDFLRKNSV